MSVIMLITTHSPLSLLLCLIINSVAKVKNKKETKRKNQKVSPELKYKIVSAIKGEKEKNNGKAPKGFISALVKKEGVKRTTVDLWLKKDENGESLIKNKKGQGRKRKLNEEDEQKILQKGKENHHIPWLELGAWFQGQDPERRFPSEKILRQVFKKKGLFKRKARKKTALSKVNQSKRLKWAEERLGVEVGEWERKIYLDEKCVVSSGDTNCFVIRPNGKAYEPEYVIQTHQSGRVAIHFIGSISIKGLGELVMFNPGSNNGNQLTGMITKMFPLIKKMTARVRGKKQLVHDNSRNFTSILPLLEEFVKETNYRYFSFSLFQLSLSFIYFSLSLSLSDQLLSNFLL